MNINADQFLNFSYLHCFIVLDKWYANWVNWLSFCFQYFCRYYQDQRDELLSVVTPYQVPTVNLFLYGDKTLSQYTNTIIFESVQKFIIGTKRF